LSRLPLRWEVFADAGALAEGAAGCIAAESARALARGGDFLIVVAGGTTPRAVYAKLADLDTDWDRWQIWFGDERCLPDGHIERNDRMAREAWLDRVAIPAKNVHAIAAARGAGEAAAGYARTLEGVGDFDLVLLGIGEDGHTASLFPGQDPGDGPDSADALPVRDAPKPPPSRVTLSAHRLSRSRRVLLLASGSGKRAALTRLAQGEDLPVTRIRPAAGMDLFVDRAAAPPGIASSDSAP